MVCYPLEPRVTLGFWAALLLIGTNGDKLVYCRLFDHVLWPNIISLFIYLSVVF